MVLLCWALSFILQLLSVKQLYYYFRKSVIDDIEENLRTQFHKYTIVVLNGLNLAQYHDITKSN